MVAHPFPFMDAAKAQAQWLLLLGVIPLMMLLLLHVASRSGRRRNDKKRQLPPSPPGLPIIGHLLLVGDRPHVSFRDLAAKHDRGGGLMRLRLGTVPNLVVSSAHAAQAILRTHDHAFASRPASTLVDDLVYGSSSVGFARYGEHWRQVRKLVITHLFTVKKVNSYHHARQEEVTVIFPGTHVHIYASLLGSNFYSCTSPISQLPEFFVLFIHHINLSLVGYRKQMVNCYL